MFLLIATIIFAGIIAFFATQNAGPVDLHLGKYNLASVPLYWVVLGSVLATLIFSWVMFLMNSISSSFVLHGRNNSLKKLEKENEKLTEKIHKLEIDNARIQEKQEKRVEEV